MTEKLFYQDSYMAVFEAKILSCLWRENRYEAVLDRTAFFPEGGGQAADRGTLQGEGFSVQVTDVQEKDGLVYHILTDAVPQGAKVTGTIDFQERFSKMQQHTGEHIVSGLVNRHFGYHNVGFHLGNDLVTMDFDGPLTWQQLEQMEDEANQAVAENLPIEVLYPSKEELETISYRSKIEIEGQIRLVRIPGYDVCACCAPHVKTTGSIGIIKITGAIHYKGGMRVSMVCGFRALADYRQKQNSVVRISNMLSAKQEQVAEAVQRLEGEIAQQKDKVRKLQEKYVEYCLRDAKKECMRTPDRNILLFVEELDSSAMRSFVNEAMTMTKGVCGVFAGTEEEGFRYVLGTAGQDIRAIGKELNRAFEGKGGGKPPMIQGSLKGKEEAIREYLEKPLG